MSIRILGDRSLIVILQRYACGSGIRATIAKLEDGIAHQLLEDWVGVETVSANVVGIWGDFCGDKYRGSYLR